MANSIVGWRAQFIFALCLPIAVLLGYLLADPTDLVSMAVVMLMIGLLSVPILMSSYHPLLILTWNAAIVPYFLPGQPFLWMLLTFAGFGFAVMNRFTSREAHFVSVPSITRPLLALLAVLLLTMAMRGGFGLRIFGSGHYGGKAYFYIVASIIGYFTLLSQRLPKHRARLFVALFFLSGLTSLIPNVAYLAGRKLEFLFYIFPAGYALEQAMGDVNANIEFGRAYGLTFGSIALCCGVLTRYGLRGIFDIGKPIRMLLFALAFVACLFCGFRSFMVLFILIVLCQFFAERLYQPRILIAASLCTVLIGVLAIGFTDKLPLVVQRSISFLPFPVEPSVRASADGSNQWRLDMWREVIPEVPHYLLKGKGYSVDPEELAIVNQHQHGSSHAWAVVTGAYHNGPLTLIIPLGIWGFGAFLWFAIASVKYLLRAYRYGDPELKLANTCLLAYFVARFIYYMTIFGNFYTDFFHFAGVIALSISINGAEVGAPQEAKEEQRRTADDEELAVAPVG